MTKTGFAASIVAIVAVATWAYNVNYQTTTTLGRIDRLRGDIAAERERIQVLRVEWAWLNSPERLERLSAEHAADLSLGPLTPAAFGVAASVPFPPKEEPEAEEVLLLVDAGPAGALPALAAAPAGVVMPPPRPASWSAR